MVATRTLFIVLLLLSFYGCALKPECNEDSVIKKTYYPSGKLENESSYRCGILDGISKSYKENGEIISEGTYKNGKRSGFTSSFLLDESREEIRYWDDKENQYTRMSYDLNGKLKSREQYKNGLIASRQEFNERGNYYAQYYYRNGEEIKRTYYYPNGVARHLEYKMENDQIQIRKEYYENGVIHYIDNYKDREIISRKAFDEEGKLKFEQKY